MRLKALGIQEHTLKKQWTVAFHADFLAEFHGFSASVRAHAYSLIEMLTVFGPQLGRPHVDTLKGAKISKLKELRFRADDGVWRIAFAFDLKRHAILLVGGDKSGVSKEKFYRQLIEIAERRFDEHQKTIAAEKEK